MIAPAHGGSDNAFLDGITGLKPSDESAESLEAVLRTLLSDSSVLRRLGDNARTWARAAFDPGRREREVAQLLLGPRTAEKHTSGVGGTEPLDLTFLRTLSS